MGLVRYRLGELLELTSETNSEGLYTPDDVRGMTITKEIIPTKADVSSTDLSKFLVIHPGEFVYNPRTHGKHIGLGYNDTAESFIISWNNVGFRVKAEMKNVVLAEYLFMHFNRNEWDRLACFCSWGSSTEIFSWDTFCDMEIPVPPIEIQRKYAGVFTAMKNHHLALSRGIEDLRLVCDLYIEDLRRKIPCVRLGDYIRAVNQKNTGNIITLFQGVTVEHEFAEPTRIAEDTENGNIVRTGQFAFNKVMKSHNTKLPIALRHGPDCVVSNSYQVFEVIDKEKLLPEYLMLWLDRAETQRYAGFVSIGTTRDIFSFDDLCELQIPIPDITIQHSIANIYTASQKRKSLAERLKTLTKNICPILIKGAIDESQKENP